MHFIIIIPPQPMAPYDYTIAAQSCPYTLACVSQSDKFKNCHNILTTNYDQVVNGYNLYDYNFSLCIPEFYLVEYEDFLRLKIFFSR